MPVDIFNSLIFNSLRGFVCEELAQLYYAKSDKAKSIYFADLAFDGISKSKYPIFVKSVAKRLKRLRLILEALG